jgi:tRNA1Val (adenine37-N6)-methyltransferase
MKVCTDACLFGAWAATKIDSSKSIVENALDIGAGTGLLSLMLAQKSNALIDAVEIDDSAVWQTQENFENSPWKERLSIYKGPIQKFTTTNTYDVIISNPPFFIQSLKSDVHQKNVAKHTEALSYRQLIENVLRLLKSDGKFYVLLPYQEFKTFETICNDRLQLIEKADIKQTAKHGFFRTMGIFARAASKELSSEIIIIKDGDNKYTDQFQSLLIDYYLYL